MIYLTDKQRRKVVDRMSGWCMMQRRGNPDMGGPSAADKRKAIAIVEEVIWQVNEVLEEDE